MEPEEGTLTLQVQQLRGFVTHGSHANIILRHALSVYCYKILFSGLASVSMHSTCK